MIEDSQLADWLAGQAGGWIDGQMDGWTDGWKTKMAKHKSNYSHIEHLQSHSSSLRYIVEASRTCLLISNGALSQMANLKEETYPEPAQVSNERNRFKQTNKQSHGFYRQQNCFWPQVRMNLCHLQENRCSLRSYSAKLCKYERDKYWVFSLWFPDFYISTESCVCICGIRAEIKLMTTGT